MAKLIEILVTGTREDPRVLQQAITTLVQLQKVGIRSRIVPAGRSAACCEPASSH